MNCNCNKRVLRASSYQVGNSFNIIVNNPNITDLDNGCKFVLILPIDLPAMTTIVPVIIVLNGVNYPVQDIIGNNLMSDQLRFFPQNRKCCNREGIVRIVFGSNPNHFKVLNCLPNSSAVEFEQNVEVVSTSNKIVTKKSDE